MTLQFFLIQTRPHASIGCPQSSSPPKFQSKNYSFRALSKEPKDDYINGFFKTWCEVPSHFKNYASALEKYADTMETRKDDYCNDGAAPGAKEKEGSGNGGCVEFHGQMKDYLLCRRTCMKEKFWN